MLWPPEAEPLRPQFSAARLGPSSTMKTECASESGSSLSSTVRCILTPTPRPAVGPGPICPAECPTPTTRLALCLPCGTCRLDHIPQADLQTSFRTDASS